MLPSHVKTRFAPTPSGYLHIGNLYSFAVTWALAKQKNGSILLRIDDLDNLRFRPEYLQDIFATLKHAGLDYTEGPRDAEDFYAHYSQRLRLPLYQSLLSALVEKKLVYACNCSRNQILQVSPDGLYPRTCLYKNLPLDTKNASWRLKVPESTQIQLEDLRLGRVVLPLGKSMPDFVIRRKDGLPSYQIASLCDDLEYGINLIVRGEDLLYSTAAQLYLAQLTSKTKFENVRFVHHSLLIDSNGNKLSKSKDAYSIYEQVRNGASPSETWQLLSKSLGWKPLALSLNDFLQNFKI